MRGRYGRRLPTAISGRASVQNRDSAVQPLRCIDAVGGRSMPDTFDETFVHPADRYRWATETIAFPRLKDIRPKNTIADIERGYRIVAGRNVRLQALKIPAPNRARKWVFTTYADTTQVTFVRLDFDRHVPRDGTPDERRAIDRRFAEQIEAFESLGIPAVWTTSPGDVVGDEHIHGRYAWIKLNEPTSVATLRDLIGRFKEFHCLEEVEFCWDTRNHNVRLPSQQYVECAEGDFRAQWARLAAVSIDALFGESERWEGWHRRGEDQQPVAPKQIEHCNEPDYLASLQSMPNTFARATRDRVCSRAAAKFGGDRRRFDGAVEEAGQRLVAISPETSRTCRNPRLLDSTVRRWMNWYFDTFDPAKAGRPNSDRDRLDKNRFARFQGIDDGLFLRAIKDTSYKVKSICLRMKKLMGRYNGRVSFKLIWGNDPICARREWDRIRTLGVFTVIDPHDRSTHKCRQWGLADGIIQLLASIKAAAQGAMTILQGTTTRNVCAQGASNGSAARPTNGTAREPEPSAAETCLDRSKGALPRPES